jgi:hypothetical protein
MAKTKRKFCSYTDIGVFLLFRDPNPNYCCFLGKKAGPDREGSILLNDGRNICSFHHDVFM